MTTSIAIVLTGREVAIIGAALSLCDGWQTPQEMQRFVNVAAEHVREGWREEELSAALEHLSGAWIDRQDPFPSAVIAAQDYATIRVCACFDCLWLGIAAELIAQACPKCDGRVCDQGSPEFTERLKARVKA